jgi:hypothetical protein
VQNGTLKKTYKGFLRDARRPGLDRLGVAVAF